MCCLFLNLSACVSVRSAAPFELPPEGTYSIRVQIENLDCCEGVVRLALYNDKAYWLSETAMVRGRLGFVQSRQQTIELHGLIAGNYAIAVYQDLDSNNKLDRWFGLLPKEPYGFSNNVGRYGPASFDKASFELTQDKTISIRLN